MATYPGAIKLQRDRCFSEITSRSDLKARALTNLGVSSTSTQLIQASAINDSSAVNRFIPNPTAKTIVDGSATSLFSVAIAAGTSIGGTILFDVFASDGTDHQNISGVATYSAVNKAGTTTRTITYVTGNEAKAVSSGTLTLAWTMTDDTNVTTIKLQPTGSLTETTYNVTYSVLPLKGAVTLL